MSFICACIQALISTTSEITQAIGIGACLLQAFQEVWNKHTPNTTQEWHIAVYCCTIMYIDLVIWTEVSYCFQILGQQHHGVLRVSVTQPSLHPQRRSTSWKRSQQSYPRQALSVSLALLSCLSVHYIIELSGTLYYLIMHAWVICYCSWFYWDSKHYIGLMSWECCWLFVSSLERNDGKSNERCQTNDWIRQTTPRSQYIWNYRKEQLKVCTWIDSPWVSRWFKLSHPVYNSLTDDEAHVFTVVSPTMRHTMLLSNTTGQQTSLTKWQPKTRFDFGLLNIHFL